MRTNTPEKYFISQLYAHKCQLPPSDDYQFLSSLRKYKNIFLISEKSLESYLKAKSLSGIYYEKRRQVRMTKVIIHPFSKFRQIWTIWMCFVLLLAFIVLPFFAAFHGPIYVKHLYRQNRSFRAFWITLHFVFIIQLACLVDVVVNFFTGYATKAPEEMVIQPVRITRSYLFKYFIVDFASSVPIDLLFIVLFSVKKYSELDKQYVILLKIIPMIKVLRLYTFYKYCHVFFSIFSSSEASYNVFCVTSFFFLFIHWSACSIFIISQIVNYDHLFEDIQVNPENNNMDELSWIFESRIYEKSIMAMYVCAWYRSVCCITRLGFELFSTRTIDDKIVSTILGVFGAIYLLILLVVFLQTTSSVARAKMAYAEIMDQVKEYMEFKKFPKNLRKKVTEYYLCLYQKHFIDEDVVLKLASDTLRKEILFRMYQRFIENVNIFSGLNQNVTIQILSKLKPVIYREGERVFTLGDYPDGMYFISFGTFAFYTGENREIGHMDDGNYFGGLSTLYSVGRYTTAVAVETSLVYKLNSEDFDEIFRNDKTLLMKLEKNTEGWLKKLQQELNIRRVNNMNLKKEVFSKNAEEVENTSDDED